jgi:hypothetical protein
MQDAQGKLIKSIDSSSGHYCVWCRTRLPLGLLKP